MGRSDASLAVLGGTVAVCSAVASDWRFVWPIGAASGRSLEKRFRIRSNRARFDPLDRKLQAFAAARRADRADLVAVREWLTALRQLTGVAAIAMHRFEEVNRRTTGYSNVRTLGRLHMGSTRPAPIPLYWRIAEDIRRYITEQGKKPGDELPTEEALERTYGVSRATVRRALSELVSEGLIERHSGRGTFVAVPRLQRPLPDLTSFTEHIRSLGMTPSSHLLDYAVVDADDPNAAEFSPSAPAVRIRRVRLADGSPVGLHTAHLPLELAERAGITRTRLETDPGLSLYDHLEAAGVRLDGAQEHLVARAAGRAEARALKVPANTPLMSVTRRTYDAAERMVEIVHAQYLGDRYDYVIYLRRRDRSPVVSALTGGRVGEPSAR